MAKIEHSMRSMTEPVYTIGVAASKLGISVHSLRQYEAEGLVIPHKTETGRRLYSELEIEKIKCIKQMIQEDGLNFAGIRRLMALAPCWKIRGCTEKQRETCNAFKSIKRPCWASPEKCHHPYPSCRDCPVYQEMVRCSDLKEMIYKSTVD